MLAYNFVAYAVYNHRSGSLKFNDALPQRKINLLAKASPVINKLIQYLFSDYWELMGISANYGEYNRAAVMAESSMPGRPLSLTWHRV